MTCWDKEGWATCSLADAADREPSSAIAMKYFSCLISTQTLHTKARRKSSSLSRNALLLSPLGHLIISPLATERRMRDLAGLLVLSLEQAVAAPYASCKLADAGARVIKVERAE